MKKKMIAILGFVIVLISVIIVTNFAFLSVSGQSGTPPAQQRIDVYVIDSYERQSEHPKISLYNDNDGFIGWLEFYPDDATLPPDFVNAADDIFLYYKINDFQRCLDILRNETPVYLEYSLTTHGLTTEASVGSGKESNKFLFDFGTEVSPLEDDFIRVTESTLYSEVLGYGWVSSTSGLNSRDRGAVDDLRCDFIQSSTPKGFLVDVPTGRYTVTLLIGDNSFSHDNIDVMINSNLLHDDLSVSAGTFDSTSFNVNAPYGDIYIYLIDDGGSDSNWIINAIRIESAN